MIPGTCILRENREKENLARKCGQILVDFVNAKTAADAHFDILNSMRDSFNFSIPGPRKAHIRLEFHPQIEKSRIKLKELFSDLKERKNLRESKAFDFFVYCYEEAQKVRTDVHDDGSIVERPLFIGRSDVYHDEILKHDALLGYCVITCLKSEKIRRLIHKCEEDQNCGKYYVAVRDKKDECMHRFCSDKCRNRWHYLQKTHPISNTKKQKQGAMKDKTNE